MTMTLTEAAARQMHGQIATRDKGLALRVGVKTVGCSGLAYPYALADASNDGARPDFVTEGLEQNFGSHNPDAESTCGCGESCGRVRLRRRA